MPGFAIVLCALMMSEEQGISFMYLDWRRVAVILEVLAFFLVTPEFLGENRLRQISGFLQRLGQNPFVLADLLTSGRRRPFTSIEVAGHGSRMDFLRYVWKQGRILFAILLAPAAVSVTILFLPWPYKWFGVFFVGWATAGQILNCFYPDIIIKVGQLPKWVIMTFLVGIFPTLSFQSWLYIPSGFAGYGALRLSDMSTLRGFLFVLGVLMFLTGKSAEFLLG